MTDDFNYLPDMRVVRSARSFIKSLCEVYGAKEGMVVWDKIRNTLSDQMACDIFHGMLIGTDDVEVISIGDQKIEAIKEVRGFTGMGLKESKDFVESVMNGGSGGKTQTIDTTFKTPDQINVFCTAMRRIGCEIR
jgi:Ribosomal protein L7/L12 C-terminal domain